jgi:hypothetical protein
MPQALLISSCLMWLSKIWIWRSTNCEAHHCAIFSSPLVTLPLLASHISLSTLFSTPSAYVLHLTWQTKFHTHTEQHKIRLIAMGILISVFCNTKMKYSRVPINRDLFNRGSALSQVNRRKVVYTSSSKTRVCISVKSRNSVMTHVHWVPGMPCC